MIEKDLSRIRRLSEKKSEENWEFRSFLKRYSSLSSEEIDRFTHSLYNEIVAAIDCKECGNCCKETRPVLNNSDIERLAKELNISVVQFKEQYLSECEEGGFWFKTTPCPFLRDNRCSRYSFRPEVCKSFPHLHKKDFTSRLINVVDNYSICPIVFNVYERLKSELWHAKDDNLFKNEAAFEEKSMEWDQRNWMAWLGSNLSFPFMAKRVDDEEDGYFNTAIANKPFRLGHKMKVLAVVNEDDLYGIMVKVREGRKVGHVPLCDLKVISQNDKNYQVVREYSDWFVNR